MTDIGIERLIYAIIRQAVDDWRALCKGKRPTKDCNFEELEYFFKHRCDDLLIRGNLSTDRILEQLQKERRAREMREKSEKAAI